MTGEKLDSGSNAWRVSGYSIVVIIWTGLIYFLLPGTTEISPLAIYMLPVAIALTGIIFFYVERKVKQRAIMLEKLEKSRKRVEDLPKQ